LLLATFTVTNAGDVGPGSFRDAIVAANNAPGADQIRFGFPASDQVIQLLSPLPAVTGPTVIGSGSGPLLGRPLLDGARAGAGADGLVFRGAGASGSELGGLVIQNFGGSGVVVEGADVWVRAPVIDGNGRSPVTADPADAAGVEVRGGTVRIGESRRSLPAITGNAGDGVAVVAGAVRIESAEIGLYTTPPSGFPQPTGNRGHGVSARAGTTVDVAGTLSQEVRIANNGGDGVSFAPGSRGSVSGAAIGMTGARPEPNAGAGVRIAAPDVVVQDCDIWNNGGAGISIEGPAAVRTVIVGNSIEANGSHGVSVTGGASGVQIGHGRVRPGSALNSINSNAGSGVYVAGPGNTDVSVYGNFIEFNRGGGVTLQDGDGNVVGSASAPLQNWIYQFGPAAAVRILGTSRGNILSDNRYVVDDGPVIDLGGDGSTANDPLDADAGPNDLQNYPVLTSAVSGASGAVVAGTVQSTPNTRLRVEFYHHGLGDPDGAAAPAGGTRLLRPVGQTTVTTDAAGNAAFSVLLPPMEAGTVRATATAPQPEGDADPVPPANTSEFSPGVAVEAPPEVWRAYVNGTRWRQPFRDFIEAQGNGSSRYGYALDPVSELDVSQSSLPWSNVDQVSVRFTEPVTVHREDLRLRSSAGSGTSYAVSDFRYDRETRVATWTLDRPVQFGQVRLTIDSPDGLGAAVGVASTDGAEALDGEWYSGREGVDAFPSGDGVPGTDFAVDFTVWPGDVDRNHHVNALDVAAVKRLLGRSASDATTGGLSGYRIFYDLDGSGRIDALDLAAVKRSLVSQPPG
jgi:hypothetical protein